jgi:hypothetical protein
MLVVWIQKVLSLFYSSLNGILNLSLSVLELEAQLKDLKIDHFGTIHEIQTRRYPLLSIFLVNLPGLS